MRLHPKLEEEFCFDPKIMIDFGLALLGLWIRRRGRLGLSHLDVNDRPRWQKLQLPRRAYGGLSGWSAGQYLHRERLLLGSLDFADAH